MSKKKLLLFISTITLLFGIKGCAPKVIPFKSQNLDLVNREIVSARSSKNILTLNQAKGDGLAILKKNEFDTGTIELELKGEDNPQKSFIGIAFNIQNDSTYEVIYFRPFNFRSDQKIRREHSIQYIYKPKYEWRFLRENFQGQFEADFPRQPCPDEWFKVQIVIEDKIVQVLDLETNTQLLLIRRLAKPTSNKIGLWTGYNSKGVFRNLKIEK